MVKPFRRRSRQARPACGDGKGGPGSGSTPCLWRVPGRRAAGTVAAGGPRPSGERGQAARPAAETRASRSAGGGPQGIAGGQLRAPEGMAAP